MSYFEIGVYHPKYETNIGTLWRSAYQMGASGIFVVGNRKVCKQRQASDTMNAGKLIPKRCYISVDALLENGPVGVPLIGV